MHNGLFMYHEEYESGELDYKIYDNRHVVIQSSSWMGNTVKYGNINYGKNWVKLDLGTGFVDKKNYLLEVMNKKGRKKYLKFMYKSAVSLPN